MKENNEKKVTHIQITKKTAKILQGIKLTKRESYDEIINRLFVMAADNK